MDTDSDTDSSDSRTYAARWTRKRRRAAQSPLRQCVRSLGGFMFGLFLASIYGCITFFLQNYGLWYCLGSTVTIAALCAFGMGLSVRVRAVVWLMLPTLCCSHGKNLLLFLIFSLVTRGPLANTLENFNRAARSVACGAELAKNQTRQLVERASAPLQSVLGKIKQITKNTYAVAGRVQSLISTLAESVNHIAGMLRNVLYFLVRIGDVCEDKLGSPYRTCVKAFNDAQRNCTELLDAASGICDVVSGMQDLCNLTKVTLVFCVVPTYVMTQMKTKLAAPTVAALEKMKRQFEFEISVSAHLDVHVNSSRSVQQVSQQIMEEVTAEVSRWQNHMDLFAYMGLVFLALTCLQAVLYKRKYLDQDDFDNIYITDKFVMMDLRRSEDGRSPLLPLTRREALIYIRPCSLYLTEEERRATALNTMSVLRHTAVGGLLVALDLLVFWMFDTVHRLAQREIDVKAPVMVAVSMNGSSYASDMFKDIVAAFDVLQKGNITVLSKTCLIAPSETNYYGYMSIGLLYGFSLFIVVAGSYIRRLRRFVCASYYPKREQERVQFLYNHILSQRASLQKVLLRFVARIRADGEPSSLIRAIAAYFPGGSCLADFFGAPMVCCMACGKEAKMRDDPTMFACSTPKCTGLLCLQCNRSLGKICPVCMGPLIFQEDSEVEIDSSDDQQVGLWTAALTSMTRHGHGKDTRQLLKLRIRETLRRKPAAAAENSGRDSDTGSDISVQSSISELDMAYQEQAIRDDSESSDHDLEPFLAACVSREDKTQAVFTDSSSSHDEDMFSKSTHLHEVMVHSSLMLKPSGQTQEVPVDPGNTEPLSPQTGAAPGPGSLGYCGTCGTCLGPDRNPQLLPCLHSLCQGCTLPQGTRASRRECPVCERSYTSLEVTANRFLKGPAVQSSTHEVSKCAGCEDFAVSGWCVECGEALCSVCVSAHQRVRVTRDHTVLHQKLPTDSVPTVFCSTHKEEVMKLFCMSCNQLTCRDCQLTYHRNHRYQFLHEAVTTQREQIESLVMRVRQQREMVSQSLQDLDGRQQDLTGLKSKLKDEMQEALVRMRYILMKRSVKLFKDVEGLCGSEVERVTERQATLKKLKARLTYVLAFTENALETGNHIALLSNKRQIQIELEDILSQNALPATSMMDVMFHCDQEICSRITKFGKIITKEVPFARLSFHSTPSKPLEPTLHPHGFAPPQSSAPYTSALSFSSANPCTIPAVSFPSPQPPPAATSRAAFTSNPSSVPPSSARSTQPAMSKVPSPSIRYHASSYQPQNSKKTWSFHNYQPKKPKLASNSSSASLDPSHCFGFGLQPSGMSLSVPPLTLSSLAVVHPVTPSPIIVSDSPPTNVLDVSSDVKKIHPFQASESVHHQTAPELWNMGFSIQSVRSLSDNSSGKDEMSFKSPPCLLPVKAIADSPCERAPPAGCGRESGVDKRTQAAENEPTSTVAEAESLFLVDAGDAEESDQRENQSLCSKKRQREDGTFSPSNVEGNAPSGPELSKRSQPATEPPQKSNGKNAWTPSSFRELLERPVNSSPDKTTFLKLQQPTSLWDLLVTDRQAASQSGSSGSVSKHDGSEEMGDSRKAVSSRPSELMPRLIPADGDEGNIRSLSATPAVPEVTEALSRTQFPQVSLWRLPVSLPPAGNPLPQFRLLPGSTENRVLLQITDDDLQFISMNTPCMQGSPDHPETECAACRTMGRLWLCAQCGRGFHRDCHIPPISSIAWGEWKCLLCQDLSDDEDPYSTERERRPTLGLVDQKKCEYLLLTLLCKKDGDVLDRSAQLSSNYIDISLIRGRLLRKLSPSYRTPSEFVSDVWVLLDTLLDVSEETVSVEKLHRCFQENLNKTFGKTLHPSLLRFPDNKVPESQVGAKSMESKETLKRTQEMATAPQDVPEKKCCQDDGCEREDN